MREAIILGKFLVRHMSIIILLVATGALCVVNHREGGEAAVKAGLHGGIKYLVYKIAPLIIVLAAMVGQVQAYYARRPETFGKIFLGENSIRDAAIFGVLMPGASSTGEILQEKWRLKQGRLAIIAFVLAAAFGSITTLAVRLPFFGGKITAIIYIVGLVFIGTAVGVLTLVQRLRA